MPRVHKQGCVDASHNQIYGLSSKDATCGRYGKLEIGKPSRSSFGIIRFRRLRVDLVSLGARRVGDHGSADYVCTPPSITQPSSPDFAVVCGIHMTLISLLPAICDVEVLVVSAFGRPATGMSPALQSCDMILRPRNL